MKTATIIIQNAVRLIGVVLLVLGFMFWSGHAFDLVPIHMKLGISLAGLLWILAILGMVAKVNPVITIVGILWGALVVIFGMRMGAWMPGPAHEVIRVLHFLIGLAAIALSEMISARVKRQVAVVES
jgi:hypothetical protein